MLEDCFLAADVDQLALWQDPANSLVSAPVKKIADGFIRGFRLAAWVRQCDLQGSAMPVASLTNKFNSSCSSGGQPLWPTRAVAMPCFSSGRV